MTDTMTEEAPDYEITEPFGSIFYEWRHVSSKYEMAKDEFIDKLNRLGFTDFEHIGGDDYDCSIELHGVGNDVRLDAAVQRLIAEANFGTAYVNHRDGWETHYSWPHDEPFAPVRGWRRFRKPGGGFLISYWPEGWNQPSTKDWLESGYMTIVPDPLTAEAPSL